MQKAVEIVVGALLAAGRAIVRGCLADRLAHIERTCARIVRADFRTGKAAEKLRERLSGDFAENIPKRNVERRIAAHFSSGGAKPQIADEVFRNPVNLERIAAEELLRQAFMDISLDGLGKEKCFAEADNSLRSMHLQPKKIGELGEAYRLESGDPHRRLK